MKRSVAVAACVAVISAGSAWAQGTHNHSAMPGMSNAAATDARTAATHRLTGTVKKVDAKTRTVTIDHAPVQSLGWPAMTMTFKVDDPAVLGKLKAGSKVDADMIQRGNDYVITAAR